MVILRIRLNPACKQESTALLGESLSGFWTYNQHGSKGAHQGVASVEVVASSLSPRRVKSQAKLNSKTLHQTQLMFVDFAKAKHSLYWVSAILACKIRAPLTVWSLVVILTEGIPQQKLLEASNAVTVKRGTEVNTAVFSSEFLESRCSRLHLGFFYSGFMPGVIIHGQSGLLLHVQVYQPRLHQRLHGHQYSRLLNVTGI